MRKLFVWIMLCVPLTIAAQPSVASRDGKTVVSVSVEEGGVPMYSVSYNGKVMIEKSPLGMVTNIADFTKGLTLRNSKVTNNIEENYTLDRIKASSVQYSANELICTFATAGEERRVRTFDVIFRVSNNDIALRYTLHKNNETGSVRVESEATGFRFPAATTTFLTPQSHAMIGWKRTKPSYEEGYTVDAPLTKRSQYGHGYTFPCLFKVGADGWVLISETGVSGYYCGSRLSDATPEGLFTVAYPMPEENNGNGTVAPALALPGSTPWRTITLGETLKPIVETTVTFDVVKPLYEPTQEYKLGKGTWSWILWQDNSINYDDQVKYIDLAAAMNFQFALVDNLWDKNIGRDGMKRLSEYAQSKGVSLFVWYSSSGSWNDIEQGPTNLMDNPIVRKREMAWLRSIGAKGIKVDFFGGDKQETMRLYEAILSDANDYGLMVDFHGCTLPRGWERMYPNYVGSEAILASENLVFGQGANDNEAFNACLHPFIRNATGAMEFGGVVLNKRLNKGNDGGTTRRTTDIFQLATAVLFQNPVQFFALAPNNLTDAPAFALDFLRKVPTTWDETRFIDGYPGKYCVLARRQGANWYVAAINATKETLKLEVQLPEAFANKTVHYYYDNNDRTPATKDVSIKKDGKLKLTLPTDGGAVITDQQ